MTVLTEEKLEGVFPLLKRIIDKADPMGLLERGEPSDSYDIETRSVARFLLENAPKIRKSKKFLENGIDEIWMKCFNRPCIGKSIIVSELIVCLSMFR